MKSSVLGFIVAFVATANAQSVSSSSAPAVATSTSSCALQATLDLCLQNEDNYIKTCGQQDFACLCRWSKEKLSCYSSCPNDVGAGSQKAIVDSYCSVPGANVSVAPWTSSGAPTSTVIAANTASVSSVASSTPSTTDAKSAAATLAIGQSALVVAGAVAAYMLF